MIINDYFGKKVSRLGFGAMRLPLDAQKNIDEAQTEKMTRYAIENGLNYFDTAFPYHSGESERVMGRILKKFRRDDFFLATKFPGHQIASSYDPAKVFEAQLEKCGVEYFDFYLLHNVYEKSVLTYNDPKWGIVDYFREQKRLGRIRHLGFSTHAGIETMREFLDRYQNDMEFCQIQLNYLDWTLQNGKAKYDMLTERGVPIVVMEPVRGGKLAKLEDIYEEKLKKLRPDESIPAWSFRFLQGLDNVKVILSGMSNMDQMIDNVKTFSQYKPLSQSENETLLSIAESLKDSIPCTSCRYCCDGCPMGLDIPALISLYNELRVASSMNITMRIEALDADKRPSACVNCGKCLKVCPQGINVPQVLKSFSEKLKTLPSWEEICRQRNAAQK